MYANLGFTGAYPQQVDPVLQVPDGQTPVFRSGNILGVEEARGAYVLLLDSLHLLFQVGLFSLEDATLLAVPAQQVDRSRLSTASCAHTRAVDMSTKSQNEAD